MPELIPWSGFYVIVGSSAGALLGLQFVIITLIAQRPPKSFSVAGEAFATPTVVHFTVVLLLSAVFSAPWKSLLPLMAAWGAFGVGGTAYALVTGWRMRRQQVYIPEMEDWVFHFWIPLAAYLILVVSSMLATSMFEGSLFGAAAAALILMVACIHNAWDSAIFQIHILSRRAAKAEERAAAQGEQGSTNPL